MSIDCEIPLASDNGLSLIIEEYPIDNFNNISHDPLSIFTNFMHGNKGEDLLKDASPANSEFDNEIDEIDVKLEWKSICPI